MVQEKVFSIIIEAKSCVCFGCCPELNQVIDFVINFQNWNCAVMVSKKKQIFINVLYRAFHAICSLKVLFVLSCSENPVNMIEKWLVWK